MTTDLHIIVAQLLGRSIRSIEKLHGDASYRTYYRARSDDGRTFIVMQMPAGAQSVSEEITNFNGTHEEIPFVNMTIFLKRCGLPVPAIVAEDGEHHLLLLEDLGDDVMARRVADAPEHEQRAWYEKALELLVRMQETTKARHDDACIAFRRSFDATLFNWEFDHFLEYGIGQRLNLHLPDGDRAIFECETRAIARRLESLSYGFTHRDFQSRNLIIKDDALHLIDYQDALRGPLVYDLVALLRDSYVLLPSGLVLDLVADYARRRGLNERATQQEFDIVTIQRKLKDAGRFVFIDRVKHNPAFLTYIPASLGYVKEAFERSHAHPALYEMLKNYVPEWN